MGQIARMIRRELHDRLKTMLNTNAAVVLTGPRQIGKTTLAKEISQELDAVYRDLENPRELDQVRDIRLFTDQFPEQLIILDEVQRAPDIFASLRGVIDERRRQGHGDGQFLFLGSASLELLGQTSESLAGRIAYAELAGFDVLEIQNTEDLDLSEADLWLRGGFPQSLTAENGELSLEWRLNLIRSYLERDMPQFGFRVPAETMRRLWTMLAHCQGTTLNASSLAKGLGISGKKVAEYLDILVDLLLVRRLPPWHANVGKRLIKSPKIYIRDTGLLHALLDIETMDDLLGHPVVGHSWEGFAIENLISLGARQRLYPYFYRTSAGAEIDLILEKGGKPEIAVEVKRASNPKVSKGFHIACGDLGVRHRYVVYPGDEAYRLNKEIWAAPLATLMGALKTRTELSFA